MTIDLRKSPVQLFSQQLVNLKYVQIIQLDLSKNNATELSRKINYLNQSYIFHLVAYWQDFIQSLAKSKFLDTQVENNTHKLNAVLEQNLEDHLKRFNTPNTDNIDKLFEKTLGIKDITNCWNIEGTSRSISKGKLKEILTSRHQIAHDGKTERELNFDNNYKDMEFIYSLAYSLQLAVDKYEYS